MNNNPKSLEQTLLENHSKEPSDPQVIFSLAKFYLEANNSNKAISYLEKLVSIDSTEPELFNTLALLYKQSGNVEKAESTYLKAICSAPASYKIHYNYAVLLQEQGETEQAIKEYIKSLELYENFPECYYNLGNAYRTKQNLEKALFYYEKSIEKDKKKIDAWYNFGAVAERIPDYEKAMVAYTKVLEINPNHIEARWNRALLLLRFGNYEQGWKEFEWRLEKQNLKRSFPFPKWQGEEIRGKKLLIYDEQGFGDTLQFVRYLEFIKTTGTEIIFECRKELAPLFEEALDGVEVCIRGSRKWENDSADYHISLLSIPHLLNTTIETIPQNVPYIKVKPENSGKENGKLKIGFAWKGNADHPENANRSVHLSDMISVIKHKTAEYFSLQKECTEEEIWLLKENNVDSGILQCADFLDTARLIDTLDIVLTVDTAIAHLAGAMGIKVWILIASYSDFRWFIDRTDSPWYPTAKLFRQKTKGNWDTVFSELTEKIASLKTKEDENIHVLMRLQKLLDEMIKNPHNWIIYSELLPLMQENGRIDEAISLCSEYMKLYPDHPEANYYYAALHAKKKNYGKSYDYLLKAIALSEFNTVYYELLGFLCSETNVLSTKENIDKAESAYLKSEQFFRNSAGFYNNLGNLNYEKLNFEKSLRYFDKSLELDPNFASAHVNKGMIHLLKEEFEIGWDEFEWRKVQYQERKFLKPEWNGEIFEGMRLYVVSEQGLGDTIQFARFLPVLRERGVHVIFECHPAIGGLFDNDQFYDEIVFTESLHSDIVKEYDYFVYLLSIPKILQLINISDFSGDTPYIVEKPEFRSKWEQLLRFDGFERTGIVWGGNPDHKNDFRRSIDLNYFKSIVDDSGRKVISLQMGKRSEDLKEVEFGGRILETGNKIETFDDTAGIISNLDNLITVDTSVAHISGAMGKKTYLLLPYRPDWRWGIEKENSYWYGSVRILRQQSMGNWYPVFEELKSRL